MAEPSEPIRRVTGTVRILTVNDVYQILAQSSDGVTQPGGWAGLSSLLQQHRTPNSVFAVNGDVLGGSFRNEVSQGRCSIAIMNYLRTDVAVVGNHEFDFGDEALIARMQESEFPWLGSNVRDLQSRGGELTDRESRRQGGKPRLLTGIRDTIVMEFPVDSAAGEPAEAGDYDQHGMPRFVRVGFTGVCTRSTPYTSFPSDDVVFEDPVAHLRRTVRQLRSGSSPCDLVVALTHVAAAEDRRIAGLVPGIDLILGGHDHTAMSWMQAARTGSENLNAEEDEFVSETEDPDPEEESGAYNSNSGGCRRHKECLVLKTGQNATWLGVVDLKVIFTARAEASAQQAAPFLDRNSCFKLDVYPSWRMEHNLGVEQDLEVVRIANSFLPDAPSIPEELQLQLAELEKGALLSGRPLAVVSARGLDLSTKTELVRRSGSFVGQMLADAMIWYWRDRLQLNETPEAASEICCPADGASSDSCSWNISSSRSPTVDDEQKQPELEMSLGALRATMGCAVADQVAHRMSASVDSGASNLKCITPLQKHVRGGWDPAEFPPRPVLGLINGGFVRGDMIYQAGASSLGWPHIRRELPFSKSTVVTRIRGRDLRQAIWEMLGPLPGQTPVGSMPQLSSSGRGKFDPAIVARAKAEFSLADKDAESVVAPRRAVAADADADCQAEEDRFAAMIRDGIPELRMLGEAVEEDALYDVVTSSFISRGGDGCLSWRKGRVLLEDDVPISGIVGKYWLRMPDWSYDPQAYGLSEARKAQAEAQGVSPVELGYAMDRPKELVVHDGVFLSPSDL